MESIECFHSIPCLGFGILQKRKNKKEFVGKNIKELKKNLN